MTAALTWLNDLVQWFGRWVPRLVLVPPTHRGVRFGPRGAAKAVGPGLIVYWPITHELIQVPVTLQSVPLCGQILPIVDDGSVVPRCGVCALSVQFAIDDPVRAATHVLHFHALIANRAQALAAEHWPGIVHATDREWLRKAKEALTAEMTTFGIRIATLDVTSVGVGAALKNIHDWSYADNVNGKRAE